MRSPGISRKSAAGSSSAEAGASGAATHDKETGEVQKSLATVAAGEIADPHDAFRSPLLIREIEVVCGYRRIRGIKKMRRGIKREGTASDRRAINLEGACVQVHSIGPRRIQVRVNAADA